MDKNRIPQSGVCIGLVGSDKREDNLSATIRKQISVEQPIGKYRNELSRIRILGMCDLSPSAFKENF